MTESTSLPALLGGSPIRPDGPPDWPIADDDIHDALRDAYNTGSWGKYHGGFVDRLEEAIGRYLELEQVLTCASGTLAVELALRALKVEPGDEVVMAAYDFSGNFLNIHALHALPVLVDVDADNWNLQPARILAALGPATRAIVVSHLHGGLVPMRQVMEIAEARKVPVVEDAAQVPGAMVQGKRAGTWGDVGIWSFGGSKLLTAGRGGALFTRHADLIQRARLWLNRGNVTGPLSELQAAVLLPQLAKLDERNAARTRNVRRISEQLHEVRGIKPFANAIPESQAAYYKLGFQYNAETFGLSRERFIAAMRAEGIAIDEGFRALHVGRSPSRFRHPAALADAERAHKGCLVLHHPVLLGSPEDVGQVVQAIRGVHAHRESLRE